MTTPPHSSIDFLQTLFKRLIADVYNNPRRWAYAYVALFLSVVVVYQLATPIRMGDTDMWYHMNGGRHMIATGQVTTQPFFSVLDGTRDWIAYYWGFQVLTYKIFDFGGYQWLIFFRSAMLLIAGLLVFSYLKHAREPGTSWLLPVIIGALFLTFLDARFHQVRPHLATYTLLLAFLYILEFHPRRAPLLPLLTVLWINLHGVTYVLGALVCGVYFIEYLVSRHQGHKDGRGSWIYGASILACLPALLINPRGIQVLRAPFAIPPNLDQFIAELQSVTPEHFTTLLFSKLQVSQLTLVTLVAMAAAYAVLQSVLQRRIRVSHILLALGGILLLPKGLRFLFEWLILNLPLIATLQTPKLHNGGPAVSAKHLLILFATALPVTNFAASVKFRHDYPFEPSGLPIGVVNFIRGEHLAGNLLTPPGEAGYVQWALYPEIRIYIDMEFPPFTAEDYLRLSSAYRSVKGFHELDSHYKFDYVSVARDWKQFRSVAKEISELVPIWFDDNQVLFVNSNRHPEIAKKFSIKDMNPFNLLDDVTTTDQKIAALKRMHGRQPNTRRTLHALTRFTFDTKDYKTALGYATKFVTLAPDDANSHYLAGNVLENLGRYDDAIPHFRRSLTLADSDFRTRVQLHLGTCYYQLQDFDSAYAAFRKGLEPFRRQEAPEDLYQGALSAAYIGDTDLMRLWLHALLVEASADKPELAAKAMALLEDMSQKQNSTAGNIVAWLKHLTGLDK